MRRSKRGFTILELLVMVGVLAILMTAAWSLFGESLHTSQRVLGTLDAQQVLRSRYQQLVHELQGSRRLFFPTPGARTQAGVGYVDAGGRSIMVFTREEGDEVVLYRSDLNARTKEVLARGVESFRVTVPPPATPGEVPRTVNLAFGIYAEGTEDEQGQKRPLKMVTSVTLRAVEERFPD